MRISTIVMLALAMTASPAVAVDFLGVELCKGSTDTAVDLPIASSLVLESVEIGDNGGLVMLFSARSGKVMNHVDDLMTGLSDQRGEGDGDSLEWSSGRLTGVAQRVAKKYAALAVTSTDECLGSESVPVPVPVAAPTNAPPQTDVESVMQTPDPVPAAAAAVVAASQVSPPEPEPEPVAPAPATATATAPPDFELIGALSRESADHPWVDVMGVIANHTETGYRLATFDLSFFATDGSLVCVDTISVSILKTGQERAFRDSIRCPGYDAEEVAETRLQFAGGL